VSGDAMSGSPPARVLVAGIGNVFHGDDGFGVEVARTLGARTVPDGVRVGDFGIRGVHLAYELLGGGYDTAIFVDAMARGGEPGTLYVLEPAVDGRQDAGPPDGHDLTPDAVLAWLHRVGAQPPRVLIVGCEPATIDEAMGLSPAVAAVVDEAAALVLELASRNAAGA
jgi:hydrogenase maturation protease